MATPSAAAYAQIKSDNAKVTADQTALATDEAADTTDETAFAASLTGPAVYLNSDGTADIITPSTAAPGFTVQTVPVLS